MVCSRSLCHLSLLKANFKRYPLWANELQKVPPAWPLRQSEATGLTPREHLAVNPHVGTAASRLPGPERWVPSVSKPIWPNPSHSSDYTTIHKALAPSSCLVLNKYLWMDEWMFHTVRLYQSPLPVPYSNYCYSYVLFKDVSRISNGQNKAEGSNETGL